MRRFGAAIDCSTYLTVRGLSRYTTGGSTHRSEKIRNGRLSKPRSTAERRGTARDVR